MSYQKDRDEFLEIIVKEGMPVTTARKLLRYAATLDRLAVALCNGDYPCDNGERKTKLCPRCGLGYAPNSFRYGVCPDCRTAELVRTVLPAGFTPIIGGDPRGCVLKLQVPSGKTNDWGREGICVPTRNS